MELSEAKFIVFTASRPDGAAFAVLEEALAFVSEQAVDNGQRDMSMFQRVELDFAVSVKARRRKRTPKDAVPTLPIG